MKKKLLRTTAAAGLALTCSGCAALGEAGGAVGGVLNLAFYIALVALPFVAAYYLWYDD